MTYEVDQLIPGNKYFLKVLAKNSVGWSDYSEYNEPTTENSETATDVPDPPSNLSPISATWGSLTFQGRFPYNNGRAITEIHIQHRIVEAFTRGPWSKTLVFHVDNPQEVEFIEDLEVAAESGYKPINRKKFVKMATGVLEEVKAVRSQYFEVL